ncbi:MAG: hypothetical protein LBC99_02775 [Spirochaetota bacterium]|jgi:predicted Zn-dependent peptidase|nr:hypothetical protein [Spirochaetota bacterium]
MRVLALIAAALLMQPVYGSEAIPTGGGWALLSAPGSLPAFHFHSAEAETLSLRVCFAASGILDESSPAPDRILFEFMTLAGRNIPRAELDRVKDGGGIIIDGQSGLEYSHIFAAAVPDETKRALGILSSLMYAPCQNEELFAEVRAQTANELLRQEGQAYSALDRGLKKTILADHPYGRYYALTADALGRVSLADALAHHEKIMTDGKIFIVSCGPQTADEMESLIQTYFPARRVPADGFAKDGKVSIPSFPEAKNETAFFPHRAANMPYLKAEFAMAGPGSASYPASLVLARVLSEMLMEKVRSDKGLVYSVWASPPARARAASAELVLYRANDPDAAVRAMRETILSLQRDMAKTDTGAHFEEAVLAAKNQIACTLAVQNITPRERCANFASWYLAGGGKTGTAGLLDATLRITPDAIISLAKNSFARMHWGIAHDPAAAEPSEIQWTLEETR